MEITILSTISTILMLTLIFLVIHFACKYVEVEHPMEIIIARRISRLQIMKSKKECKIKELKFYKNKNNKENTNLKINSLRLELFMIEQEMIKLLNYGKS